MLPEPPAPLPPVDDGRTALDYLAAYGLIPYIPTIRASDFELALADPFRYYLTRRLGLAPRLSWTKALSRGSWAHHAFFLDTFSPTLPDDHRTNYLKTLATRLDEIRGVGPFAGLTPATITEWLEREAKDADTAYAWYSVHRTVAPSLPHYPAFPDLIRAGTPISSEQTYHIPHKVGRYTVYSVIQPDLLWLDAKNRLWIIDLKTCSESPKVRLSTCPIEFQARHYAHTLAAIQDTDPSQLPEAIRTADIAGVMHIAVQKPTIEFSGKDRDFTEKTRTITRGARKGETVVEREYADGPPRWENYLARCRDWLLATGEYAVNAKERASDPCVNYSFVTSSTLFSRQAKADYQRDLTFLRSMATRPAHPEFFPKSARGAVDHDKPTFWAPFYLNPVVDWPGIVESLSLMSAFRDDSLLQPA